MDVVNNKNIIYISYDGMTDPLGQSQVLPYIVGLSKLGYRFDLISCEKPENYLKTKETIEAICNNANIIRHPIMYTKKPPILSTVKDILAINNLAKKIHQSKKISLIHCRSYISSLIGLGFKRKHNIPFLFDMRGFWADERVDGGIWNLKNPLFKFIYNYFKKKEKQYLIESAAVVSLTYNGKDDILKWGTGIESDKITVIPCCVDLEHFNPSNVLPHAQDSFREELNIKSSDTVICYLGSIGTWYMLDEMLDFYKTFSNQNPNAKFLFITQDDNKNILAKAEQKGIPANQLIFKKGQRKDIPTLLTICNFSIFFITPKYSKKSSSPTKQGEIMAMGIPVICNAGVGDTDIIVEKYKSGVVCASFTNDIFKEAAITLQTRFFDKMNIRNGAIEYFSLEQGISMYHHTYLKGIK